MSGPWRVRLFFIWVPRRSPVVCPHCPTTVSIAAVSHHVIYTAIDSYTLHAWNADAFAHHLPLFHAGSIWPIQEEIESTQSCGRVSDTICSRMCSAAIREREQCAPRNIISLVPRHRSHSNERWIRTQRPIDTENAEAAPGRSSPGPPKRRAPFVSDLVAIRTRLPAYCLPQRALTSSGFPYGNVRRRTLVHASRPIVVTWRR